MFFPININIDSAISMSLRISLVRQFRYDLKFKEKYLDLQAIRRANYRRSIIKYFYIKIFDFTTSLFHIPDTIREKKTKSILKRYIYYKFPPTKIGGFVNDRWQIEYKRIAEQLIRRRLMGKRVKRYGLTRHIEAPLIYKAKPNKQNIKTTIKNSARFYVTTTLNKSSVLFLTQNKLQKFIIKPTVQKFEKPKTEDEITSEALNIYDKPQAQPLKLKKGFYLLHGKSNLKLLKTQNKLRKQNQFVTYTKKLTFPKTRDKSFHKKNNKLSAFNKLLQREYLNPFFHHLTVHFNFFKSKLNNLGRNFKVKKKPKFIFPKLSYIKKFVFFWHFTILGFLFKIFPYNLKLVLALIKNGLVYINGSQIWDPFYIIDKLNIIHIDLPYFFSPMFGIFVWKFSNITLTNTIKKKYFLRFGENSNTEVNYKTTEILLLPTAFDNREYQRDFLEMQFQLAVLFSQRFFPKQKKFGLGRLI